MEATTNDIQAIPYSHHYRCFPQMVGSPANQAVFMYLMDEYIYRLRTGKDTKFAVSIREVAQKRNVNRRTITKSLEELQNMQLITLDNKFVTIHANRYVSLIKAFYNLKTELEKQHFIDALNNGDGAKMRQMGYKEVNGNQELLSQQGGAYLHHLDDEWCKNAPLDTESGVKMHHLLHNTNTTSDDWCIFAPLVIGNGANMHHLDPHDTSQWCKNAPLATQFTSTQSKLVQKYTTTVQQIRLEVREKYTKMEFVKVFFDDFSEFLSENELEVLLEMLYGDEVSENCYFNPLFALFMYFWGGAKMHQGWCKNAPGVVQKCTTVNKEINKNKKENSEGDALVAKEKEKEDFFELDREGLEQSISSYQNFKRKQTFPFFPVNEIQEYISDIRNCLDRADKIYINQVWEILHECFDQEAIFDEDGNEELPANSEIENIGVAKERLKKDILFPAFDKTQEIIEAGSVTVNGEQYQVTATIDHPGDFENIIDWELQTLLDGENYIISSKRVRNIFGEQVAKSTPRSAKRENREDDMGYMQKIILIGDDDACYSQLTPIELTVYNFLNENFQIGETGEVEEPAKPFVSRTILASFYIDAKDKGISETDFLSILSNDKPDGTGSLNLRQRMFSADKIRKWNRLHTIPSIVDEFKLPSNEQ